MPAQIADEPGVFAYLFGADTVRHARRLHYRRVITHVVNNPYKAVIEDLEWLIQDFFQCRHYGALDGMGLCHSGGQFLFLFVTGIHGLVPFVRASGATLLFFDVAVKVEAREHVGGLPAFFQLCYRATTLVFSTFAVISRKYRPCFKKDNLRDAPADNQWDVIVGGVVGYLHRPAVDVAHVAPAGALASQKKGAAEG